MHRLAHGACWVTHGTCAIRGSATHTQGAWPFQAEFHISLTECYTETLTPTNRSFCIMGIQTYGYTQSKNPGAFSVSALAPCARCLCQRQRQVHRSCTKMYQPSTSIGLCSVRALPFSRLWFDLRWLRRPAVGETQGRQRHASCCKFNSHRLHVKMDTARMVGIGRRTRQRRTA